MPQAIPFIIEGIASYLGASEVVVGIIALAGTIAYSEYEKKQAEEAARQSYLNSLQDRTIQVRSGVAVRGYAIGTVRLGGALLYINPIGAKQEALDQVIAFANNECTIEDWIIGDDFVLAAGFPGTKYGDVRYDPTSDTFTVTGPTASVTLSEVPRPTSIHATARQGGAAVAVTATQVGLTTQINLSGLPSGSSTVTVSYQMPQATKLRGQFHAGTLSQTAVPWVDYPNFEWDSGGHNLAGVCHIRSLYIWDQNFYQQGAPQMTAVLTGGTCDGYPFFDPRDNSHPTSTKNPAIVWAWWRTLPRFMGGCGVPVDWIDYSTVAAAANICDELMTVLSQDGQSFEQIKRYECDTYLSTGVDPLTNKNVILSAMAGTDVFTDGKYKVFAGAFRPAAFTLTDNDIVGKKALSANSANVEEEPPNIVTAVFADATQQWAQSNPDPVRNDTYVTDDGYENPVDVRLDATSDPRRVRYLMGIALERARPSFGVTLSVGGIGEVIGPGDTIQLNLTNRPQYVGRTFEIIASTDNWDGTNDLVLQEMKAQTFALDPTSFTPVSPAPPVDNSYLWNPPDPTGFLISSISPTTLPDGTAVARVVLVWNPIGNAGNTPSAFFEIRYRKTGGDFIDGGRVPGDATSTTLTTALQDGELYQFEIRFVNGFGANSDWVDAYTGVDGAALPSPQSLRLSASSQIFKVPQTGNPVPVSITLTAVRTGGLTAAAVWSTNPSVTLGGSGDVRTLAYSAMGSNDAVEVTVTVNQDGTYVDKVTIVKVLDGKDAQKDLTAPPTPTGLTVTPFLVHLLVKWDVPTFTQGHGYAQAVVYAAQVTAQNPNPTFGNSTPVGSSATTEFAFPATPGTTWAIWIKWQSVDGVLSAAAEGPINGTTAQIGTANLGADIITAQQLADGSVTAAALAAGAIDNTKLASGLQAVVIVTGTLPSTNVGDVVYRTNDAKLYKWNGTSYVATIPSTDIAGQLTDSQIAAIAAAKITGQIASTQITDGAISTPKLAAGSVTSAQIAADTITAGNIAAGAITASELATGSVTAGAIAANAVTAGKIAAAAVNAQQIAAGAISTDKLLVTGRGAALNDDPAPVDVTAWTKYPEGGNTGTLVIASVSDGVVGATTMRNTGGPLEIYGRPIAVDSTKTYRVRAWARTAAGNGTLYVGVVYFDQNLNIVTAVYPAAQAVAPTSSFVLYQGNFGAGVPGFAVPAGAKYMAIDLALNWTGTTGYAEAQDCRIEEVVGSSLIVDGAITATKLAANSIIAGSAAIANGAISNAMIANASIDTAKIIDLSVSTLKIQDHAVTVPSSVSLASPTLYSTPGQEADVISLGVISSGFPIFVVCSVGSNTARTFSLRRDGVQIAAAYSPGGSSNLANVNPDLATVKVDQPAAGSHTYALHVSINNSGVDSVNVTDASIFVLEIKK